LRRLFEITNLAVRIHDNSDDVTISIRLPADDLPQAAHAAEKNTIVDVLVFEKHDSGGDPPVLHPRP
jgi:hypothetical protein